MNLLLQNIHDLDEALNLLRLDLEGHLELDHSRRAFKEDSLVTVGFGEPNFIPAELYGPSRRYYDVLSDIEWCYADFNKAWEGEDWRWWHGITNASQFNPLYRFYRQRAGIKEAT